MKILLLGGTGAMGVHLADILASRREKVFVTTRGKRDSSEFIEYIQGDAKDDNFLNTLLKEKWDVVVDFMVYKEDEFQARVHKLLDATSQYIFLSSSRVYDNSMEYIKEDSTRLLDTCKDEEYLATSEYALSKARQEDILKSSSKQNWTIIRPYITYSEIRLQLGTLEKENWLYRALQGRTIVFSEDIKNHFTTVTYGFDVAKAMVNLMNQQNTLGQAYHITSNTSYTWEELLAVYLDAIEEMTGKRPKVLFQNMDDFSTWNHGKYQIIYDRLYDRRFDNSKINEFINTAEFIDAKDGLKRCLKEFMQNPKFNPVSWRMEAKKDKFTKEFTPLNEINGIKNKIKYILFRYFI
ncbi:NAD-dependent epimerase/dehydratase family protein [Sulfurimonas sp. CVO]|uniref:NAD-dependent epimerase/dehydratase family protein n=1 Tax=Sulfurimonas sp. CVO TaxID=2283483 RepID=UPI00132EFA1B|nr:NAD-dependent epimerase/dehydratase family protein [Sulfurimonas sp. CVO]QHG91865.1 NAD-dependent epimerase/dehydratase family protein [Sulfurimonas sp. CVO]